MSFGDDALDPTNINQLKVEQALKLLNDYLSDFPEHDQGDFRVWQAAKLLEKVKGI